MSPREFLASVAFGYALAWAMPLAAWIRARAAARRGDAGARAYFDDMAAHLAMGALNALPLVVGVAACTLLVGGAK